MRCKLKSSDELAEVPGDDYCFREGSTTYGRRHVDLSLKPNNKEWKVVHNLGLYHPRQLRKERFPLVILTMYSLS